MSLLPKTREDFRLSSYWDQFFQQRGTEQPFEWYGSYKELRSLFRAYTKQDNSVLVLGCGNSSSSADMFLDGYKNILNIDFSKKVIDQMKARYSKMKTMRWEIMDMRDLKVESESFNVVFDKGGLDALVADETPEIREDAIKMLNEVHRVLRPGGVYFCVSIAQEYVFRLLLEHFSKLDLGYKVSIHPVPRLPSENESPLVSFAIVIIKSAEPSKAIFIQSTNDGDTVQHGGSIDETMSAVKGHQMSVFSMKNIRQYKAGQISELGLQIPAPGSSSSGSTQGKATPKYTLKIVDGKEKGKAGPTAAFLVPQGRERDFMFSKDEGLLQLVETTGFTRLIVVYFSPYHKFSDVESVTKELSPHILEISLLPESTQPKVRSKGQGSSKIPFLTASEGLGKRELVHKGVSSFSGSYRVENVEEDDETYRRLVFDSSPNVVQSEAKLVKKQQEAAKRKGKKKGTKSQGQPHASEGDLESAMSSLAVTPASKSPIDVGYLPFEYHQGMVAALSLASPVFKEPSSSPSCLVIGLGGGMLPIFLHNSFPTLKIDCVELDPEIADIAKRWFGFEENERLRLNIADGLEFVKGKEGIYDVVIIDVDSKDISEGLSCPPASFVESAFLELVKTSMKEQGLLLLNLSCRAEGLRNSVLSAIATVFVDSYYLPVEGTVNVVVCGLKQQRHATLSKPDADIIKAAKNIDVNWTTDIEFIKWMIKLKRIARPATA